MLSLWKPVKWVSVWLPWKGAWKRPEKGLKKGLWWGGRKFNSPPWRPASSLASSTCRSSPRSARSSTTITRSTTRSEFQDTLPCLASHLLWFRPISYSCNYCVLNWIAISSFTAQDLAEFIIDLAEKNSELTAFTKALADNGAEFADSFIENILRWSTNSSCITAYFINGQLSSFKMIINLNQLVNVLPMK